ncbi:MAG: cell division protein FtsW [Synergistaceae bacterium]|nr:cell division protein FtsW [Synergistaceae bacterium]
MPDSKRNAVVDVLLSLVSIEVIIPLILSGGGLIMISSLSLRNSMAGGNPYSAPLKQFQFIGLGITMMIIFLRVPTQSIRKSSSKLFGVGVLLLVLTLIPGLGVTINGARRWLNLPGFRFQPVELMLLAVPALMAKRLTDDDVVKFRTDLHAFISPTIIITAVNAGLLLLQPNLGSTIIIAAICFVMYIERRGWQYPLIGMGVGIVLVGILILVAPYRMSRLLAFLDPWDDPMGRGFQIIQGLVAFANGSVTGVGIGRGLQEERYLPEAASDYIFPAIGEEFGLVGTLTLMLLYALWTWRAYYVYREAKTPFTKCLALGLTASVIFPMFVNVAGVTKLMPLTGIPMPFISAGGSAMIFMWAKIGILMRIKMESRIETPKKEKKKKQ